MQLSAYAAVTGAFERYPSVLGGARELGLLACVVLLAALVALARSLGVRPLAAAAGLGSLALCPPAIAALTTFGPGLLGAAWLTAGAALLARGRTWLWILGAPAVLLGIASAPVLAVLVLVISAAVVVTVRVRRRGPSLLGVAVLAAALPLALLPPPGGAAAVPALVALVVLVGLVLLDEAVTRLSSRSAMRAPRRPRRAGRGPGGRAGGRARAGATHRGRRGRRRSTGLLPSRPGWSRRPTRPRASRPHRACGPTSSAAAYRSPAATGGRAGGDGGRLRTGRRPVR